MTKRLSPVVMPPRRYALTISRHFHVRGLHNGDRLIRTLPLADDLTVW